MAAGDIPLTITGNLTADPELKFTPAGVAMVRFTIASTPRVYDRETGQYKDGTATFLRCTAWRQMAEHVADSLTKGTRVIASGRLRQHDWKTVEGENRSMLALDVDEVGPSLRFATATPTKAPRKNGGGTATGGADAWAGTKTGGSDEPPF